MNIIDTPGIAPGIGGDSYEEEQDQENIDSILDHISCIKEIQAQITKGSYPAELFDKVSPRATCVARLDGWVVGVSP